MNITESNKTYDVAIVGSGAGGGMATKILAEAGFDVAVLEAGPFFDPARRNTAPSSDGHGNRRAGAQVPIEGRSVISTPHTEGGI